MNDTLCDADTFIEQMKRDHKTTQQAQVKVALKIIEAFAEVKNVDPRNADAVTTCRGLINGFKKNNHDNLPSIYLGNL